MKSTYNRIYTWAGALALAMVLASSLGFAAPPGTPLPNANAYQRDLPFWLETYWTWYLSGGAPEQSVVDGYKLLALPAGEAVSGSGTPEDPTVLKGSLEVTLPPGTPFVLPIYALLGETYKPELGYPDDQPFDDAWVLGSVEPTLTIDGQVIVSPENKADFYVPATYFDQVMPYDPPTDYGAIGAIFFQGGGIVGTPLKPGVHVIHLYEPWILTPFWSIVYDNTWIVTVEK